jgi:hypothetical protein
MVTLIELVGKCSVFLDSVASRTEAFVIGHFGSNVGSTDAERAALPQTLKDRMSTGSRIATSSLFAYIFLIYFLKACIWFFFLRIT